MHRYRHLLFSLLFAFFTFTFIDIEESTEQAVFNLRQLKGSIANAR